MYVEGVRYYPFRIRYRLADGKRRSMKRWAPALVYMRESALRELLDRFGLEGIAPNSVTIRLDAASC